MITSIRPDHFYQDQPTVPFCDLLSARCTFFATSRGNTLPLTKVRQDDGHIPSVELTTIRLLRQMRRTPANCPHPRSRDSPRDSKIGIARGILLTTSTKYDSRNHPRILRINEEGRRCSWQGNIQHLDDKSRAAAELTVGMQEKYTT